ncbi:class I SAM-dependent methyltransferase [Ramlibacter albus]|uniref:Methyltransferase domain-containing protein n=1 Tax=Ramlibacter albus TaxID=2079448 RepID=A0A923M848_9BURK|nr:class I SAM-dependent methyltransferase [Ramlibacter albus]MBC5765750.1 methyltransferase domain-containing protein [Ramlibacter albus]
MSADDLKGYYRSRAPEYDQVYAKPERQQDLRAIEAWLPTVFAGKRVLEVACGTGYWTQFIAPAASGVLAVDSSPETMRIAATRPGVANVQFVEGDAYRLPEAGTPFEAAFAGFWISHVPRQRVEGFLVGLRARLAHGATVVLLDNRFVPGSSTPIAETDADGNTYQQRPLADGSTHRVLKNFPAESQVRTWLEDGAAGVTWHEWEHYWAVEYTVG